MLDAPKWIGLLECGIDLVQDRRDPVRGQAKRLIAAFEAYGIARQQIARVLPADLQITPSSFSTPDKLRDAITPSLLDWAAEFLIVDRGWLDGVGHGPHLRVEGYKDEERYADWFRQRAAVAPSFDCRTVMVWSSSALEPSDFAHSGVLCLLYSEATPSFDGKELDRYWLLSRQWPLEHAPCLISMCRVVQIAESLRIRVVGRVLPERLLRKLDDGRLLAPQVASQNGKIWYPEDLVPVLVDESMA